MEHDILIDTNGDISFVYADELAQAFEGEQMETVRASHVEPWRYGGWFADMSPSGGPSMLLPDYAINSLNEVIGRPAGFQTRQAALDAERAWLREHKGL